MNAKFLAFGCAAALVAGCADDTTSIDSREESKTSASVAIHVAEIFDGSKLDSVSVLDMGTNEKKTTKDGRADFREISNGDHAFLFSREGYATLLLDYAVNLDGAAAALPIERDEAPVVKMHRMGAQATGLVKFKLADGSLVPAAKQTVTLMAAPAAGEFVPNLYSAETDSTGRYLFDDLPELSNWGASVINPVTEDALVWRANTVNGGGVVQGQLQTLGQIVLSLDSGRAAIDSVTWHLGLKDPFVVWFSDPVDLSRAKYDANSVKLYNSSEGGALIGITLSWSKDARKLTVSPASGSWEYSDTYDFEFNLTSVQGKKFPANVSYEVKNVSSLAKITGLKIVSALSENDNPSWNGDEDDPCVEDTTSTIALEYVPGKGTIAEALVYVQKDNGLFKYFTSAYDGDTSVAVTVDLQDMAVKPASISVYLQPCTDAACLPFDKKNIYTIPVCE